MNDMKKLSILGLAVALILPVGIAFAASNAQSSSVTPVLIAFDHPVGANEQALVRAQGGHIKYSYTIVNAIAASVPQTAIDGLRHSPHVTAVEADDTVYATSIDSELNNSWGVQRIGAGTVHAGDTNLTADRGAGVNIGIIDSGLNYNNPEFAGRYKGGYDFVQGDSDPMDVYGHGTHVAGTACANEDGYGTTDASGNPLYGVVGVAPECNLYSLRVLNDSGVGNWSDIIAALQWATGANPQGVKMNVVNLSLGQSRNPGGTVQQAFDTAAADGVVIVAAAGNSGNGAGKGTNTIYPANYDSVIAVGATDSSDNRASFSSTGSNVELAAPGVSVYSTWNDDTSYLDPQPNCDMSASIPTDNCYKFGSGTSMASPHVAGVAALIIAAGVTDAATVRSILDSTADDLGAAGKDSEYGYGLVDAVRAVQAAEQYGTSPMANAGPDQTVIADSTGYASVTLNGSGSSASSGATITSYDWSEGGTTVATGISPTYSFAVGTHTITLTVTDSTGATASDMVQIDVQSSSSGGGGGGGSCHGNGKKSC